MPHSEISTSTPNLMPQPGDHIYGERGGGLYQHHGIYSGDGMVIHLQGKEKSIGPLPPCQTCVDKRVCNGEIAKTCLDCFLDKGQLKIYQHDNSKPAHEVIKMSTDFLEGGKSFGRYNLVTNNCEDFAMSCKRSLPVSTQVVNHLDNIALAALPLAAAGMPAASLACLGVGLVAAPLAYGAKMIHAKRRL